MAAANGGATEAKCIAERIGDSWSVRLSGRWTLDNAMASRRGLDALAVAGTPRIDIDLSSVDALDTAGAWIVYRFAAGLEQAGAAVRLVGATRSQSALLERMAPTEERQPLARPYVSPVRAMVERMGRATLAALDEAHQLVSFFGLTFVVLGRTAIKPMRLRPIALVSHIERIGLDALPIVGLLSFLIGVVLAYQGADQLRQFGAEIYTVNLLGVSVLREIGVLMTAIMVAGRSGSAFTAEIGTMKVNEEVDAMMTLGLDPMEVLVLPRLIAMAIALPLLVFFADVMALLGGAMMTTLVLDIALSQFIEQLREAITVSTYLVGLVKAPFFAFLIAMVGCYEGLKVSGSAESVGLMTTKSVVESIFLVIVADAAFSILFSYVGL